MHSGKVLLWVVILAPLAALAVEPATYAGMPQAVDGDELVFYYAEHPVPIRVRIAGIWAPGLEARCRRNARIGAEETVACGRRAHRALAGYVAGRFVACRQVALAGLEQAFGVCRRVRSFRHDAPKGEDLGSWLVGEGWAKAWPRDAGNRRYLDLELGARRGRKGLWRWVFPDPWVDGG